MHLKGNLERGGGEVKNMRRKRIKRRSERNKRKEEERKKEEGKWKMRRGVKIK